MEIDEAFVGSEMKELSCPKFGFLYKAANTMIKLKKTLDRAIADEKRLFKELGA